ncbi:MAG: GTP pyrophosphokinase family protein [Eubacterium sp.]|nr:GTP pyrophosphokinase family protein [Eubacterium sp.]
MIQGNELQGSNNEITNILREVRITPEEAKKWLEQNVQPYRELMAYYRCAIMEIETKFNVLNEELSLKYDRNPIETIKSRLKSTESIAEKMQRKGIFPTVQSIEETISDIAGIRVICSFPADIYMLEKALLEQDDVRLVEKKDYIKEPKKNGYRSLHLIVETPIFLHDRKKLMKVEVQLRTISMDWWASLEHKIKYKKDIDKNVVKELEKELLICAEFGAKLDSKMEEINKRAHETGIE